MEQKKERKLSFIYKFKIFTTFHSRISKIRLFIDWFCFSRNNFRMYYTLHYESVNFSFAKFYWC